VPVASFVAVHRGIRGGHPVRPRADAQSFRARDINLPSSKARNLKHRN
jgi:hypothetical protein